VQVNLSSYIVKSAADDSISGVTAGDVEVGQTALLDVDEQHAALSRSNDSLEAVAAVTDSR
jgi:hypothetical protein